MGESRGCRTATAGSKAGRFGEPEITGYSAKYQEQPGVGGGVLQALAGTNDAAPDLLA